MADRKNKRAYLDDFEKDLNGNYQYKGAHCYYTGKTPRGRVLAQLWLCIGGGAVLTVGAGALPGATAHAPIYLLLPYMAALVTALYAVVLLARMTHGGEPMRAYIHEQTAQKLPTLCTAAAVLSAAAAVGQGIAVFTQDAHLLLDVYGIFILFAAGAAAAFAAAAVLVRKMKYEKR